jgi:hypothetical protein
MFFSHTYLPFAFFLYFILTTYLLQFRQEYRLERKVLNELSIDRDTFPVDDEELSSLVAASNTSPSSSSNSSSNKHNITTLGGSSRHRISRVVVLHNDKLETFFNNLVSDSPQEDTVDSPSLLMTTDSINDSCGSSSCSTSLTSPSSSTDGGDFFFDNDSFWSGSLTWY